MHNAALEHLQNSILSGDPSPAAALVRAKPHMSAIEQIAIYSNGYRMRLRAAVLSDYPCLVHYCGDKLNDIIDAYVKAVPSTSYNLDFYPLAFWRFAQNILPLPLAELAELEGSIAECFMQHGDMPLEPQHLPQTTTALADTHFHLRAPSRLLQFTHDVEQAMAGFKRGEPPTTIAEKPIHLFVHRHNNEVRRRLLEAAEYYVLQGIATTTNFNDAIQHAMNVNQLSEQDFSAHIMRWLPRWISEGFLAAQAED